MQKAGTILVALVIGFFLGAGAWGTAEVSTWAYYTGNTYKKDLKDPLNNVYISGVADGICFAAAFSTTLGVEQIEMFNKFVSGKPSRQIIATTDKYMNDHPEHWHYPMAWIICDAVMMASGATK